MTQPTGPAPKAPIRDLREGIELLKRQPGEFVSTAVEVDPHAELAGVYKKVGAGGTVQRPTQVGPAMLFENVKGYDIPVIVGVLASRKRVASFLPKVRVAEDQPTGTGFAMPEFPGYDGPANPSLPIIKVTAVTTRTNPILQTLVGPGEEHVTLAGVPTEGSLVQALDNALPGLVTNVYSHPAGGGKYVGILQIHKRDRNDQGRERQAAIVAFGAFPELKHVILVDDDVDIFDTDDVLWAMTTRFQAERSVIPIPGVRCHPLDPSADPRFLWTNVNHGISTKVIFDCTVPWELRDEFIRAPFEDVDVTQFLPGWPGD